VVVAEGGKIIRFGNSQSLYYGFDDLLHRV
jgi:hypothetical protein